MRVKIDDFWHEVSATKPIMIELTENDKYNISNMAHDATKYAIFHDNEPMTKEEKMEWME